MPLPKSCVVCREDKTPDAFHKNSATRDGLCSTCKACACARTKAWKAAQPRARIRAAQAKYYARHASRIVAKQKERYGQKNKARLAALYQSQKAVFKARAKAWRLANPEKRKEMAATYAKAHPLVLRHKDARRRARVVAATVGPVNYERIYERDKGTCWMCGCKPEGKHLHFDHVIPISKGGPHTEENLRVACSQCNWKKGARIIPLAA